MYCGKCGAPNIEEAKFCCACGAPLEAPRPQPVPSPAPESGRKRHRAIGIAVTAAAAAIVLVLALVLLPGGGYKKTVSRFMDAALSGDIRGITDTLPPRLVDETLARNGWTREELDEAIGSFAGNYREELEHLRSFLGENISIEYRVPDGIPLPPDELLLLQERYTEYGITVKKALTVDTEITCRIGSIGNTSLQTLRVIRADGHWYIDITGLYPFL